MDIHADSPLLFAPGATLFLEAQGQRPGAGRPRPYVIAAARENNGRLLLRLVGVDDRTAAEALRGAVAYASEADLPPPDEGEEYLHRLMGAQVFLPDGANVGVFEAILDTPGQLTFVIRAPGRAGGAEILFPAVPEFLLELDAEAGRMVIDPPPGLLELYLDEAAAKAEAAHEAQADGVPGADAGTGPVDRPRPPRRQGRRSQAKSSDAAAVADSARRRGSGQRPKRGR